MDIEIDNKYTIVDNRQVQIDDRQINTQADRCVDTQIHKQVRDIQTDR